MPRPQTNYSVTLHDETLTWLVHSVLSAPFHARFVPCCWLDVCALRLHNVLLSRFGAVPCKCRVAGPAAGQLMLWHGATSAWFSAFLLCYKPGLAGLRCSPCVLARLPINRSCCALSQTIAIKITTKQHRAGPYNIPHSFE